MGSFPPILFLLTLMSVCVCVFMCVCVCVCARSLPCGCRLQSAPLHRLQWRTVTTKLSPPQMSVTPVPPPLSGRRSRYRRTCRTSPLHCPHMASKELCIIYDTKLAVYCSSKLGNASFVQFSILIRIFFYWITWMSIDDTTYLTSQSVAATFIFNQIRPVFTKMEGFKVHFKQNQSHFHPGSIQPAHFMTPISHCFLSP